MHLLPRLFESLGKQKTDGRFQVSVAVVDNDGGTAEPIVRELCNKYRIPLSFDVESEKNFALVRNRVVKLAKAELLAFIDDDEVPVLDWLLRLRTSMDTYQADGVLGPVRPYFDQNPPKWVIRGQLCERPSHPTGAILHWSQTRTGNVLLRSDLFRKNGIWFDPAYATGGEDTDYFKRAMGAGAKFVWCEEGPVYELVPAERLNRSYFLKRALLQGRISLKFYQGTGLLGLFLVALKTTIAAAAYFLLLPFVYLRGEHVLMKYLIKLCHHLGRIGAFVGSERTTVSKA
jgi:succinoglycan biosynthesis protein ExoM